VATLALAVSGGAAPSSESTACKGIPETITGLTGTNGHDVIVGTESSDEIDGKGGNDLVCAKQGDDTILGGTGNDLILSNAGNDAAQGGLGDDKVKGNAGGDGCGKCKAKGRFSRGIYGGPGNDIVGGGTGDDLVDGEQDDDLNRCAAGFDFAPDDEGVNEFGDGCEITPNQR